MTQPTATPTQGRGGDPQKSGVVGDDDVPFGACEWSTQSDSHADSSAKTGLMNIGRTGPITIATTSQ
jgi:hypothetical protein